MRRYQARTRRSSAPTPPTCRVWGTFPSTPFCSAGPSLWVPETPHTSRDLLVLVEQPTEPVVPSDAVRVARRSLGEWS
jgi:hypothetical protein